MPEEFKEHVKQQGISNERLESLLIDGPRNLFDVFDEHGIYIETHALIQDDAVDFACIILNEKASPDMESGKAFATRVEAEQYIINKAFELLDKQLQ